MMNALLKLMVTGLVFGLSACSMHPSTTSMASAESKSNSQLDNAKLVAGTAPGSGGQIGGYIAQSMDSIDRSKLAHALDKPLGKETAWENKSSGASYRVIPTSKLTINGNPFCRRYTTTVTRNNQTQEYKGSACVASDGSWTGA